MILYRTPGRSFTRPPRTSTIECSCRLWPTPGMYAVTSMPLVRRTRATFRSAEFGFFGVVVYTRVQTPRRWGEPFNAGVLVFSILSSRPLRTSWLIVGMGGLDLLPALGRAHRLVLRVVVLCRSCRGADAGPDSGRPAPSGPRGRACRPPQDQPMTSDRTRFAPRDSAPPPSDPWPGDRPRDREASTSGHPGAPRTGAGPGHPGHS